MQDRYDLHSGLGYQLTIAARTNNAGFEESLATLGLTRQTWCVLVAVGEQKITTPSAIADYIGIIRPAASRSLKQMDQKGLLKRSSGDGDKRSTTVALTDRGRELLQKSKPFAIETRKHIDTALSTNEQILLSQLLEKLTASMQSKATGV